jgi:OTU domain-containing protein 5
MTQCLLIADWEATNEAIEEQVARESYLQWLRDNERRHMSKKSLSSTVTSGELRSLSGTASPMACCSKQASVGSPLANQSAAARTTGRDSPKPGSSQQKSPPPSSNHHAPNNNSSYPEGFQIFETESFLNGLPPSLFGKNKMTMNSRSYCT